MNAVLKVVLSLSLSGSVLILALLVLGPALRDRVSKRWQYYIWLVVIARLLLPLTAPVSLAGLLFPPTGQTAVSTAPPSRPEPVLSAGDVPVEPDSGIGTAGSIPAAEPVEASGLAVAAETLSEYLWLVWLGAALALLVRKITLYQSFVRYIRAGWEAVDDVERLDRLSQLCGELGVGRPVELYINPLVSSPLLLGFFRPCIVLPAAELPDGDFCYTIRHELTHYRRRDMFYKWLVQLTLCVHWFNPLVWLMSREIGRACELACDEAVIRTLDEGERRAYGDTLLRAMGAPGTYKSALASVTLNESAQRLKERLGAIIKFKETSKLGRCVALVLTAALLCGAVLTGAYADARAETDTRARSGRTAGKILSNALKGDGETFYYTQDGYYQAPYLFELGWNARESAGRTYSSLEIPLAGGETMTVFFHDACAGPLQEGAVRDALSALLARLREENAGSYLPLVRPFVVSVQDTGGRAPGVLAEEYYQQNALPQFGPVFAMLTQAEQRAFLERICEDEEIAFFSVSVKRLRADSPLLEEVAETLYKDGDVAFFSVLAQEMSEAQRRAWLERAVEDGQFAIRSVLLNSLEDDEGLEAMKEEQERRRAEEYAAHGITREGNAWWYNGQRVRIFLDMRPDSSFATLNMDPQGDVDIHVIRDENEVITAVAYMTEAEVTALFGDMDDDDWE